MNASDVLEPCVRCPLRQLLGVKPKPQIAAILPCPALIVIAQLGNEDYTARCEARSYVAKNFTRCWRVVQHHINDRAVDLQINQYRATGVIENKVYVL